MAKILVVDDEKSIRNTLKDILETEEHQVVPAEDGPTALQHFDEQKFDVVLCDIKMQEMDGIEVLGKILEKSLDVPVIMISGNGDIEIAVDAIKKGAFDFLEKPLDLNRLLITLRNALERSDMITETRILKRKISKTNEMVGESEALEKIKEMI